MKKIFWGVALGLLLFGTSGCGQETVESGMDTREAIQFGAYLGKQSTRAAATDQSYLWSGVPVWVFDGLDNLLLSSNGNLEGPTLTLRSDDNGARWFYTESPLYYPVYNPHVTDVDLEYNFISIYPAHPLTYSPEVATFGFSTDNGETDLIAAQTHTSSTSVSLQFEHLLSRINFAVQVPGGVEATVSNIKLRNIANDGTFTFAWRSSGVGSWASISGGAAEFPYGGTFVVNSNTGYTPLREYTGNDLSLYLLPQTFADPDACIEFTFSLVGTTYSYIDDTGATKPISLTTDPIIVRASLKDFVNASEWEQGLSYTYLIDFSRYLIDGRISFESVTVGPWVGDDINPDGTITLEMHQLTQETLDKTILSLDKYYQANPIPYPSMDGQIQNIVDVTYALEEAVTLEEADLNSLYYTIYRENLQLGQVVRPYKFVIYLSKGVDTNSGLVSTALDELIKLRVKNRWEISYIKEDGSSIDDPSGTTPLDLESGAITPFYIVITPLEVQP